MAALTSAGDRDQSSRYFAEMYGSSADPYGLRTRWYEARKLALLLAALPRARYANAYEPGCGIGATTLALAARCDRLLASDFAERAVQIAASNCAGLPQVRVERQRLPEDWPDERAGGCAPFDLIVLSEIGYFLDAAQWQRVVESCRRTLAPGATLLACHWRPMFDARRQDTDAVHAALGALGLPRILRHEEDDFLLELWSSDGRSVAQREGIR